MFYVSIIDNLQFLSLAFQGKGVLLLPAPVCLSCPSVCKLYLVSTTTYHRLELESPNLHHFNSEFQEMAFNAALVYHSLLAKGCYAAQRACYFGVLLVSISMLTSYFCGECSFSLAPGQCSCDSECVIVTHAHTWFMSETFTKPIPGMILMMSSDTLCCHQGPLR